MLKIVINFDWSATLENSVIEPNGDDRTRYNAVRRHQTCKYLKLFLITESALPLQQAMPEGPATQ